MKSIQEITSQITNHKAIIHLMEDILDDIDPDYPSEKTAFREGVAAIKAKVPESFPISIDSLIDAYERRIAGNLLFLAWKGLHLNLDCFRDATKRVFLDMDYEDIHQEEIMNSMPYGKASYDLSRAYWDALPEGQKDLLMPVTDYFCYLETTAYKIAHFIGFRAGDDLLPFLEPGYVANTALSSAYAAELQEYLQCRL